MDNSFDFDKYISSLSDQAPKQAPLPAPTSLPKGNPLGSLPTDPVHEEAPQQAIPIQEPPSVEETYLKGLAREAINEPPALAKETPGSYPFNAIPESPLSILERAHLGWARTPENQKKILDNTYGSQNVQLVHNGQEGGFVVKDKDGIWKQIDPAMSWHMKDAGRNIMDLPGDLAQFAGEYGLRSSAAGLGAAQGMAMGMPAGPLGMAVGGLTGAMAGAGSAEAVDMASRKAMPADFIGSNVAPHDFEGISKQLYAAMLFGAEQEVGGQVLKFGGSKAIEALSGTIKRLTNTPSGRALVSKVFGAIGGLGEDLTRVRVDNPQKVAVFDTIANKDLENRTNNLGELMQSTVQNSIDKFQDLKGKVFGPQYAAIRDVAEGLEYNPLEAASNITQALTEDGYLVKGKVPTGKGPNIERQIGSNESSIINYVARQSQKILNKSSEENPVSYGEMQNMIKTLDAKLYESDGVTDPRLRGLLSKFRADLKNHLKDTLAAEDPETALKYSTLDAKYGPVKQLMEELAPMKADTKVDGFIKKVVKDDGGFNASLMKNLSDLFGSEDPTESLLQMHVARKSTSWTSGKKLGGVIPGSPALVATAVTLASDLKQGITQPMDQITQAVPYLNESWQFLKQLGFDGRKQLFSNPQAIDTLGRIVSGGVQGEQQTKKKLLNSAGVQ